MKVVICSVRDIAADVFGRPFFVPTKAVAMRHFSDEVNRIADDNSWNRHPEHFELYELGVWDDQTAKFEMLPSPKQLATAQEVKRTIQ